MATEPVAPSDSLTGAAELMSQARHVEVESRGRLFQEQNPNAIVLDTAENVLLFEDCLSPVLNNGDRLTLEDTRYPKTSTGDKDVREAIAAMLSHSLGLRGDQLLRAEQIIGTGGVTGALYLHAVSRLTPGRPVLLPTPCWSNFMKIYSQVRMNPEAVPGQPGDGFALHLQTIQRTYADLRAQNKHPQALVLTNPHNPLGINYSRKLLDSIYRWVLEETDMQIVSDEIYAHSQFKRQEDFVSALALGLPSKFDDRVSVMWGFSKDFGLSGFKGGILISRSAKVVDEIGTFYARFSPFDNLKNTTFRKVVHAPLPLLETYRKRLSCTHQTIAAKLEEQGIAYQPGAVAGQFFWLDLRKYLDREFPPTRNPALPLLTASAQADDPREKRLNEYLSDKAQVVLLRGQSMSCPVPGFFRMCFTCESEDTVLEAVRRMGEALRALRSRTV